MRILCFGDSNTYGYDPRAFSGGRYPVESRWVDLLAQKSGWEALNAGENGREIPRREYELRSFEELLSDHAPIDLLLIMLGCNDLLQGNGVEAVAARMERFLGRIPLEGERILLIGPPPMKPGDWAAEERLLSDSARLAAAYGDLAKKLRIRFADAGGWEIDMAFDGVHFSEAGSKAFADKLFCALADGLCRNGAGRCP